MIHIGQLECADGVKSMEISGTNVFDHGFSGQISRVLTVPLPLNKHTDRPLVKDTGGVLHSEKG